MLLKIKKNKNNFLKNKKYFIKNNEEGRGFQSFQSGGGSGGGTTSQIYCALFETREGRGLPATE